MITNWRHTRMLCDRLFSAVLHMPRPKREEINKRFCAWLLKRRRRISDLS